MVTKDRSERATLSQIETLLKRPEINVNAVTEKHGLSALHYAVCCTFACGTERIDVVKMLLQYGANPHAVDHNGCSVLQCCCHESVDVMELLIMRGVNIDSIQFGGMLMSNLAYESWEPTVHLLIAAGADVNFVDPQGSSCLCHALLFQGRRTVNILMAAGAIIDQRTRDFMTARNIKPPHEQVVKAVQHELANVRLRLALSRVFEICVALHNFQISVLEMCLVLEFAVPVFCLIASHVQWRIVKFIRHSTSQSIAERAAEFENLLKNFN